MLQERGSCFLKVFAVPPPRGFKIEMEYDADWTREGAEGGPHILTFPTCTPELVDLVAQPPCVLQQGRSHLTPSW